MLKNKLEWFIVKRVVIIFVIAAMIVLIFLEQKFLILAGLVLGTVISLLRFGFMGLTLTRLLIPGQKFVTVRGSIVRNILSQLGLIIVLVASVRINLRLFMGVCAGVTLVPLAVIINSITEGLGLTHNNFE